MTDNAVLELLKAIQAELAPMRARLDGLPPLQAQLTEMRADMHALRLDMDATKGKIDAWPDLHFLQAAAQRQLAEATEAREHRRDVEIKLTELQGMTAGHTRTLNVLQQDVRLIRAAVNDIARTDVTSGEVEAIHHDLNRLQQQVSELTARLEIVERRPREGGDHH